MTSTEQAQQELDDLGTITVSTALDLAADGLFVQDFLETTESPEYFSNTEED